MHKPTKPSHYDNSIDPIEFMAATFSHPELMGFLRGNVVKYVSRYDKKNGLEDLYKAKDYLDKLIDRYTNEDSNPRHR